MLQIIISNRCKKDLKRAKRRGLGLDEFFTVIDMFQRQEVLPARYHDHTLTVDRAGLRDCHIRPDQILICEAWEVELMLLLAETGNHSDLRI